MLNPDGTFRTDPHSVEQARILAVSLVVAEQLRGNPDAVLALAWSNVKRWGWLSRAPEASPACVRDWLVLLQGPVDGVLQVLEAPLTDERAVHLRSTQPFAGVVHFRQRWALREQYRVKLMDRGYAHP